MEDVKFKARDKGSFVLEEQDERLAEMVVGMVGSTLTVYHTAVLERLQGQGTGKKLFDAMIAYARQHNLRVDTYCPFVQAQFKKQPDLYTDVWQKGQPQLKFL